MARLKLSTFRPVRPAAVLGIALFGLSRSHRLARSRPRRFRRIQGPHQRLLVLFEPFGRHPRHPPRTG